MLTRVYLLIFLYLPLSNSVQSLLLLEVQLVSIYAFGLKAEKYLRHTSYWSYRLRILWVRTNSLNMATTLNSIKFNHLVV